MKKGKSITLLSIIGVIMALLVFITFVRFPIGIKNFNSVLGAIQTDYDVSGGTAFTAELAKDNVKNVDDIDQVIDTVEYRLRALGYNSFSVKAVRGEGETDEDYSLRIELKADKNSYGEYDYSALASNVAVALSYGELEFFGGTESDPGEDNRIFENEKVISKAEVIKQDSSYVVAITFTNNAYDKIVDEMGSSSYYLKITLGGVALNPFDGSQNSALSKSTFAKTLYVTTNSEIAANQMALQITSGGLAYKYDSPVNVGDVTCPYGNVELASIVAVSALIVLSIVAFIILFKGLGFISSLCLVLFELLELNMLVAVPGIKVSLGGVFGIILATVLAIDGLVVTAKRVKEESNNGKTVKAAINTGLRRAVFPVLNATIASIVVSLLLFAFGNGFAKGFATTFGIGSALALISSLLFTRMFIKLFLGAVKNKEAFFMAKKEA